MEIRNNNGKHEIIDFCGIVVTGSTSAQNILYLWQCRWSGTSWPPPCSAGSCLSTSIHRFFCVDYFKVIWGGLVSQRDMPRSNHTIHYTIL